MILPPLTLIVPDGTGDLPVVQLASGYGWPESSDVLQPVAVKKQNGDPYPLISGTAGIFAVKHLPSDSAPFFQREWTVTNAGSGLASLTFSRNDKVPLDQTVVFAKCGIQFRDDNTGFEDAILLPSDFSITPPIADFSDPVTPATPGTPLGVGPAGNIVQAKIFAGGGLKGDTIVFDTAMAAAAGAPGYRALKNGGYTPDATFLAGWLLADVTDGSTGAFQCFGVLPAGTTGLAPMSPPLLTVDGINGESTPTGRLRQLSPGEIRIGYIDGDGNVNVLIAGALG